MREEGLIKPNDMVDDLLALNLYDLDNIDQTMRLKMLKGKLSLDVVRIDPTVQDQVGLAFECDLHTAALTIDVLQNELRKIGDKPLRMYLKRAGGRWNELPSHTILTVYYEDMVSGTRKLYLNPIVFPQLKVVGLPKAPTGRKFRG